MLFIHLTGGTKINHFHSSKDITNASWVISTTVDNDGHLTIWVSHEDNSGVIDLNVDIADDKQWAESFSTVNTERRYQTGPYGHMNCEDTGETND